MTDQQTPEPEPDFPDDLPDDQLPTAERQRARDLIQKMIAEGNASVADTWNELPAWLRRRAWRRYQRHFEDDEPTRERNVRRRVAEENATS